MTLVFLILFHPCNTLIGFPSSIGVVQQIFDLASGAVEPDLAAQQQAEEQKSMGISGFQQVGYQEQIIR